MHAQAAGILAVDFLHVDTVLLSRLYVLVFAVYHIRVDNCVIMAAEHDLAGPLIDLVTAVMALGGEI